jgi:hypothetical protein
MDLGSFEVVNPYNGRVSVVPATPEHVHTVVLWSKNFAPFLSAGVGDRLQRRGYHLFFNFTLNSRHTRLEPHVPPLPERIRQLETLCRQFDPRSINWRFDPICFYTVGNGRMLNNLNDFEAIAVHASKMGIVRCITSFMDPYAKIRKRLKPGSKFSFVDPPLDIKQKTLRDMSDILRDLRIELQVCCEKAVLDGLPAQAGITGSSCVPNDLLKTLYGGNISTRLDRGQRIGQGCGCKVSVDIGSYRDQPCYHNCLFCYANPVDSPQRRRKHREKKQTETTKTGRLVETPDAKEAKRRASIRIAR